MRKAVFLLPIILLSACATIVNGSSQTVTVSTTPAGATCTVDRVGARIGAVAQTPGSMRLDKSKNDLSVTCSKPGFQTATVSKAPSFGGATFGNLIAGGVIGVVVDAASGANYEYPGDIRLELAAEAPAALPPLALQAPVTAPDTVEAANAVPARSMRRPGVRVRPVVARSASY
jgi:hypothetical protein